MQVERVDFVSFLTQDLARAKRFYTEVLGLEIETEGESDLELRAGQVTLDVFDPSSSARAASTSATRSAIPAGDGANGSPMLEGSKTSSVTWPARSSRSLSPSVSISRPSTSV